MLWTTLALAKPVAPELFCESYEASPFCVSGETSCTTCHALAGPPARNPYGQAVQGSLSGDFAQTLPLALAAVETRDSDGDGVDNLAEVLAGTQPGFDSSVEPECATQPDGTNPYYKLGEYDHDFAYRRVMLDFCGRSPRYAERAALAAAEDPDAVIQDTLDLCLQSPYWREVLQELAVDVVRPIGPATDINVLGNWQWDVRLFVYAMSQDRDAGELLTASYLVVEEDGALTAITEPRDALEEYAQPLPREHRYGLITTRYSLAMNVMFSAVPRTLAAHVYRKLLGFDIARSEGLYPVDEADGLYDWAAPRDVDDKGVWQEGCASCHSTLDALSYPWARYNGIDLDGDTTGAFLEDRATDILPSTTGAIFGQEVTDPYDWVQLAVESEAFSENTVGMLWTYLFRREPYSCEEEEFTALWTDFHGNGRRVEDTLRLLVTLDAYGAP